MQIMDHTKVFSFLAEVATYHISMLRIILVMSQERTIYALDCESLSGILVSPETGSPTMSSFDSSVSYIALYFISFWLVEKEFWNFKSAFSYRCHISSHFIFTFMCLQKWCFVPGNRKWLSHFNQYVWCRSQYLTSLEAGLNWCLITCFLDLGDDFQKNKLKLQRTSLDQLIAIMQLPPLLNCT